MQYPLSFYDVIVVAVISWSYKEKHEFWLVVGGCDLQKSSSHEREEITRPGN